jgi:hypothetical protein
MPDYKKIGRVSQDVSFSPQYIGMEATDLYLCGGCGNVVGDKTVHDEDHKKREDLEERFFGVERRLLEKGI